MFVKTFFFLFGDRLKNFCKDLFFLFFGEHLRLCPWPRIFFCDLGLEPCVLDSTSATYTIPATQSGGPWPPPKYATG